MEVESRQITHSDEIWRDIPNYEGYYQVSNLGNVRSLERINPYGRRVPQKILTPKLCGEIEKQYYRICLRKDRESRTFGVHRLVAMAFIPNPNNYEQVDHINRDKANNTVENLRWVNGKMNCRNTPKNVLLTFNGETHTIAEWSEITGLSSATIQARKYYGWSDEETISTPIMSNGKRLKNNIYKRNANYSAKTYLFNGKMMFLSEIARELNIPISTLDHRIKRGMPLERAFSSNKYRVNGQGKYAGRKRNKKCTTYI